MLKSQLGWEVELTIIFGNMEFIDDFDKSSFGEME